jgi:hypothetical protein
MLSYRKERIDNAILFFAEKHRQKTKKYLSQTFLYKYLAFFEFRCLKKTGGMPLELEYKAMEHGPVPVEIYSNRDNPAYFVLAEFEPSRVKNSAGYIVKGKPGAKFEPDYFAEDELEEMNNLIEIFARQWVNASTISDASHQAIKAWRNTYFHKPNAVIDPALEFDRDVSAVSAEDLTPAEERYLFQKSIREYCVC